MQAARGEMPGLPTRLAQRTSRRLDLESGQLSKSRTVGMTKIFNDPKSCIFSSYLRCWPPADPPGPRSDQDDRLASVPPSGGGPAADSSPRWRSAASSLTRCSRPRHPRGPRPRRVRRGTRTADARRARGPGASRRPRGTARGPGPSPQIVMKRQRRLSGIEKIVLSLTATA